MEIAPMTKRDKILLYVVLMLAFVVLFVRFLLIPGIENHQQADADLREAQDAQTSMQDAIMLAGTYAAEKNNNWGELQTANASYYSLLSSDELDTLVTSLELNHNLQPDSLTIGEPVTQSLTYYTASENAGQSAAPSAAASAFAGDDDSDDDSITADTAGRYLLTNQNLRFGDINWTFFIAGGVVVILIAIAYIVLKKRYWFW